MIYLQNYFCNTIICDQNNLFIAILLNFQTRMYSPLIFIIYNFYPSYNHGQVYTFYFIFVVAYFILVLIVVNYLNYYRGQIYMQTHSRCRTKLDCLIIVLVSEFYFLNYKCSYIKAFHHLYNATFF